jgi:hypothetical protein
MNALNIHTGAKKLSAPQRGAALIVMLALVGIVAVALVLKVGYAAGDRTDRDTKTALALGQARDALIARAAMDVNRPGSLPCPDTDNDGSAQIFAGVECPAYVGRLPWRTLGLPDLRDGSGERLWYALSRDFRDKNLSSTSPFNSDTPGTFTVSGSAPATNVVAIVFSAGGPVGTQVRDPANENNVANYLEGVNASGGTAFSNALVSDTFNDRLLVITPNDLWPVVERRIAHEARVCLRDFSQQPSANSRFPWAAPVTDTTLFADVSGTTFGRIPQTLTNTGADLGDPSLIWPFDSIHDPGPPTKRCFQTLTWWDDWRELLFYQVSNAYEPGLGAPGACPANCLTVNGVGSVTAIVIVAGRTISASPDQSLRPSQKSDPTMYLETDSASGIDNATGSVTGNYVRAPVMPTGGARFNDKLECLQLTLTWPCGS